MSTPVLTIDERRNIETGSWFAKLSQPLRQDKPRVVVCFGFLIGRLHPGEFPKLQI